MKATYSAFFVLCFLIIFSAGVAADTSLDQNPVLKVSVFQSGRILIDGEESSLQMLKASLKDIKKRDGVVWFYREAGENQPTEASFHVFRSIVEARLPVSLSSKPDFSNYIDKNGVSHPRRESETH